MSYLLGIDVGTTRTAAAISRTGARPGEIEIVNLGDRSSAVPSVLYLGDDGAVLVGEAAERRAMTDPDHIVREFKRRIGDPTPVVVSGRPWAPEELSARLVHWVVDRVGQREGGPAARIAVTHPASWGNHKKDLLGGALAHQGLPVTFLAEPQAAAIHYAAAERMEPGSTIAVYDFGGGTFDAALVHKDPSGSFGLIGRPEGLARLGGIDFDEVVFEHVREGLPEAFDGLDESDPAVLSAVAAVRRECTEAKEALSSDTEVSIPVLTPAAQGSVRLHRSEFEAMIRPYVEETVEALRRAVSSAGLTPEQLAAVLLVGGSSRIPLVAQLVSEQLRRPVAVDADPKNAIAKGAALFLMPVQAQVPAPRGPSRNPIGAAAYPPRPGAFGGSPVGGGAIAGGAATGAQVPALPTQRIGATGGVAAWAPPPGPPPRPADDRLGYSDRQDNLEDPAEDPAYDHDDRPRPRRNPALLVTAGAVAAALIVVGAVFVVPNRAVPTNTSGLELTENTVPPAAPSSAPAEETTEEEKPPPAFEVEELVEEEETPPVVRETTRAPVTTRAPATTRPPAPTTEAPAVTTELPAATTALPEPEPSGSVVPTQPEEPPAEDPPAEEDPPT